MSSPSPLHRHHVFANSNDAGSGAEGVTRPVSSAHSLETPDIPSRRWCSSCYERLELKLSRSYDSSADSWHTEQEHLLLMLRS